MLCVCVVCCVCVCVLYPGLDGNHLMQMAEAINCCYARTAVRTIVQKLYEEKGGVKQLTAQHMPQLIKDYNALFDAMPAMQLTTQKHSSIKKLMVLFYSHWDEQNQKEEFLHIFSFDEWSKISLDKQKRHTIRKCTECPLEHASLITAFPAKKKTIHQTRTITIQPGDLSSASALGKTVCTQLDAISHQHLGETATDVLVSFQNSGLIKNPGRTQRQRYMRSVVKKVKQSLQNAMDDTSLTTVMANRISWNTFNKIRTATLSKLNDRKRSTTNEGVPPPKRKKNYSFEEVNLIDQQSLLHEARSWQPDKSVNWSQLAKKYKILKQNGGQIIKEWLKKQNIPAANRQQREQRKIRRARRTLPGSIPFPMPRPQSYQKQLLQKQVQSGTILVGEKVVETQYSSFKVDTTTNSVLQLNCKLTGQKIRLIEIRKKLLKRHEELGLIRNKAYEQLTTMQAKRKLEELGVNIQNIEEADLCSYLKRISYQRFLKVWHDHSSIANHEHFLVVISCIYDREFYFTPEELDGIDVQSIVEKPELHIIARSSASLDDQALFNQSRLECIKELSDPLFTTTGIPVHDIVRFFHGDGPAQQFEAGNNIGGTYPCVCCTVNADSIRNLACAFKCATRTLTERQQFVISGSAWKKGGTNPFDKLKVSELIKELNDRGYKTDGMKKPDLDEMLKSVRQGISNLPPLLKQNPKEKLDSIGLGHYEVSPCEPLHDIKGHFSNLIDATEHLLSGKVLTGFKEVKAAILGKATLRCSDYRKAMILFYLKLKETNADQTIADVFKTAVHLSHILYTSDYHRTPKAILALHNLSFIHGMLCIEQFSTTKTNIFGRYFHSITTHSPILFRIVSMRSMNTEDQERMFGQAKAITKATSCNRPNEILTNIIQRVQMESGSHKMEVTDKGESEVNKLSRTIGPRCNTIYSDSFIKKHAAQYQAHLERISDYLLPGEGTWWKHSAAGVEFLDGHGEKNVSEKGPTLMHYRTKSMRDIEIHLQQKWEDCILSGIKLPAVDIEHYIPYETNPDMDAMWTEANTQTCSSVHIDELPEMTATIETTNVLTDSTAKTLSEHHHTSLVQKPQYHTSLVRSLYEHNILQPSETLSKFDLARYSLKNMPPSTENDALQTEYTKLRLLIKNKIQKRLTELVNDTQLQNIAKKLLLHEWKIAC